MACYDEIKQLYVEGRHGAAVIAARSNSTALTIDPAGCTLFAALCLSLGDHRQGLILLARAAELDPLSAVAWHNHGMALQQADRWHDASASYRKALECDPDTAGIWLSQGEVLTKLGDIHDALRCFEQAVALDPEYAAAHAARGLALQRLKLNDEALCAYETALALNPNDPETWINLGALCQQAGYMTEALSAYETALDLKPGFAEAWSNRAKALQQLGRLDEAIESFDEALRQKPEDAVLRLDRGMCLLLAGDHARGFADYEARLGLPPRKTAEIWPLWQGQPLEGRRILVTCEQGHGDTFQFVRYLRALKEKGAEVTLQAPRTMLPVLGGLTPICKLVGAVSADDGFDFQIALLSLPHRLGVDVAMTVATAPYLSVDPTLARKWQTRIGTDGFRIGIAWQGNPTFKDDRKRSVPLKAFSAIAGMAGVRLLSLQRKDGLDQLRDFAVDLEILPGDVDAHGAFADTAAIVMNLDLVITSDSAIAHLAGALGRSVWLALPHLPDWRWQLRGETSAWYPTMRLFRQQREGDWDGVFRQIRSALTQQLGALPQAETIPLIPCSFGELIDKITILEIKAERMHDPAKLRYVREELKQLQAVQMQHGNSEAPLAALSDELRQVNRTLWEVEDELRLCEARQSFDAQFVALARSVYVQNDRRAELKREINLLTGSGLVEQKSYAKAG